jgi:hypothetical protein
VRKKDLWRLITFVVAIAVVVLAAQLPTPL